jgi:ribonuclease R
LKMSKKRKSFREFKPRKQQQFSRTKKRDEKISTLENIVLSLLHAAATPLSFAKLQGAPLLNSHGQDDIQAALDSLIHAGLVNKDGKNHFRLHKNALFYEGTLVQHPKGFGFVNVSKDLNNSPPLKRDPFISPAQMGSAHHGDKVLIRVFNIRSDDRPEGSVVKILFPGTDRIGGIYVKNGRDQLVYPDDRRFPFTIRISDTSDLQPKHGDGVIAQFERANGSANFLKGKIIEILGRADDVDTQMRLVIEQFNLPFQFSEEVVQETERLDETFTPEQHREDLRTTDHVTIDGESAKDFDDAVSVTKTRKGFRLFVSIADVSHFVTPGSAIDREAYSRGTSIYFPGRVIPMLPEKLSNNLCSLVPGEDRFTVSAILDFDRMGKVLTKRFCRSIIRSQHRFTYTTVQKILIDQDPVIRKEHKPFLTQLKWAEELATILQAKRKKRGSINLNLPEPEFTLTDSGKIDSIKVTKRTFAHQIIEEFMLAANEAVAELFSRQATPAIFRVHEPPESIKAEEFFNFAKTLGFALAPFEKTPAWFAGVLEKCKDTKYEYIINNLLLRSMQQAQYSAKNVGHFGLAASDYTHFTSPIRRYPDLIVHRELLRLLPDSPQKKRTHGQQPSLKESGEFLSTRERTAIMAERDMNDRLKIGYMKNRVGDSFDAIISGVTENALYIEVQELCISGSIPVESLDDDYYILDKKNYRLFGEISAKTYQIGDIVRVTVVDVDILSKRIQFKLASNSAG